MNTSTRLQNLRDFTVQIRYPETQAIAGNGIVVSKDGKIVTCARVVQDACGHTHNTSEPSAAESLLHQTVQVYFPQAHPQDGRLFDATVVAISSQDANAVLLQIAGDVPLIAPEHVAIIGSAERSANHAFRTYGFCGEEYPILLRGTIQGTSRLSANDDSQPSMVNLKSDPKITAMVGAAILDVERNLVVGIVTPVTMEETQEASNQSFVLGSPFQTSSQPQLKPTAYAINTRVLSSEPFDVAVYDMSMRQRSEYYSYGVGQSIPIPAVAYADIAPFGLPPIARRWAGQKSMLPALKENWTNSTCHIVTLVGDGGEGKSSLVRRWIRELQADKDIPQPAGIFWWSFHERHSVDECFIAALDYLSDGRIDPFLLPSGAMRAAALARLMLSRRYLIVLDGVETHQHEYGDSYGLLTNPSLRELFYTLAGSNTLSLCVITSRAPLFDLIDYTSYVQHTLERITTQEGKALLQRLTIQGDDSTLERVADMYHAQPFALRLVATHVLEAYEGDAEAYQSDTELLEEEETYTDSFFQIARFCDTMLTDEEQCILALFSVFRSAIPAEALLAVLAMLAKTEHFAEPTPFYASLLELKTSTIQRIIKRLRDYSLLTFYDQDGLLSLVPTIRDYAEAWIASDAEGELETQVQCVHACAQAYFLELVNNEEGESPDFNDLLFLMEACYHACRAGAYDEAWDIYRRIVPQHDGYSPIQELGLYETALDLLKEFFPNPDNQDAYYCTQVPLVRNPEAQQHILHLHAMYRSAQAYPRLAAACYQQNYALALTQEEWETACNNAYRFSENLIALGDLAESASISREVLELARLAHTRHNEMLTLTLQARIAYLRGFSTMAGAIFSWAQILERDLDPDAAQLLGLRGLWYAEYLWRNGAEDRARDIVETNLPLCETHEWKEELCICHRLLALIETNARNHEQAYHHYREAIKLARSMPTGQHILIEILLAYGCWAIRGMLNVGTFENEAQEREAESEARFITSLLARSQNSYMEPPKGAAEDEEEANIVANPSAYSRNTARRFTVVRTGIIAKTRGRRLRIDTTEATAPERRLEITRGNTGGRWYKTIDSMAEAPSGPGRIVRKFIRDYDKDFQIQQPAASSGDNRQRETARTFVTNDSGRVSAVTPTRKQQAKNSADTPRRPIARERDRKTEVSALQVARSSLEEALSYAISHGYRIHEVDIRVGLARLYQAIGDSNTAKIEAEYAHHLSQQTGYYWGGVAAEAVLADL